MVTNRGDAARRLEAAQLAAESTAAAAAAAAAALARARGDSEAASQLLAARRRERAAARQQLAASTAASPTDDLTGQQNPLPEFDERAAALRLQQLQLEFEAARKLHDQLHRRAVELGAHLAAALHKAQTYGLLLPGASASQQVAQQQPPAPGSPPGGMPGRLPMPPPPQSAPQQQQQQQPQLRPPSPPPIPPPGALRPPSTTPPPPPPAGPRRRPRSPTPVSPPQPPFRVVAAGSVTPHTHTHSGDGGPVCDKCLQPIDEEAFRSHLEAMWLEVQESEASHATAESAAAGAAASMHAAESAIQAELAAAQAQQRRVAWERERLVNERAAAASAASKAAAERQMQEEHEADSIDRRAVDAATAAVAEAANAAGAAQQAAAAAQQAEARAGGELDLLERRLQALPEAQKSVQQAADMPLQFVNEMAQQHGLPGLVVEVEREWEQLKEAMAAAARSGGGGGGAAHAHASSPAAAAVAAAVEGLPAVAGGDNPKPLTDRLYNSWAPSAQGTSRALSAAAAEAARIPAASLNPVARKREGLEEQAAAQRAQLAQLAAARAELEASSRLLKEADVAFGRSGIPSFVLEGLLGELQAKTSEHLQQLASGMALELRATRELGSGSFSASRRQRAAAAAAVTESGDEGDGVAGAEGAGAGLEAPTKEEILKVVKVRVLMERYNGIGLETPCDQT